MKNNTKTEQELIIADKFRTIKNRDELLILLNEVAKLYPLDIKPRKRVLISVPISQILPSLIADTYKSKNVDSIPIISIKQLDFFSSSFLIAEKKRKRYRTFKIKKKSGAFREIKAPLPKLKEIQRALNIILQSVYTTQDCAYGFVKGKNIVDNATLHAGATFVLNVDIKDFFPAIYFRRLISMLGKEPFNLNGEREQVAYTIANLCTENGYLPQGAPTSPLFTNIICQRLDKRLQLLAQKSNATYSRYADDITFSCKDFIFTSKFIRRVQNILKDDRFELNTEKTRIQTKAYRQEVTGLTVNENVNVNKIFIRSYRTLVYLYKTKGVEAALEFHKKRMPISILEQKFKKEITNTDAYIQNVILGKYNFICMVKGQASISRPFENKKETEELPIIKTLYPLVNSPVDVLTIAAEPTPEYSDKSKKGINTSGPPEKNQSTRNLVKQVLDEWESNLYNNGFEKAMKLFKKHLNGH